MPLPNLIIAGVNKAATTSLYAYLATHADICASPIKEVQYFLPLRYGKKLSDIEAYSQHFSECSEQKYRLEATGGYFYGGYPVAEAIQATLADPKIILVFREPINRLFSFYKFKKSTLELPDSITFEEYIDQCQALPQEERKRRENNVYWGIEGGFYANYVEAWLNTFHDDNLKILFFEDIKKDTLGTLIELCHWLHLPHENFTNSLVFSTENKTVHYKNRFMQKAALTINWYGEKFWRTHPKIKRALRSTYYKFNGQAHTEQIAPDTRARLEALFHPHNQKLAHILRKKKDLTLPNWLEQTLSPQN
ncbi:sulfotransferase domain-containing protein [Candidatus Leptofilum sp.]|uniref:sulfotransferase domain-containing protein n=1 Tax=Candidatus Leptofilum sp. TaxID=3241576 RepID=UPI003B597610